jgi:hypothetical protein
MGLLARKNEDDEERPGSGLSLEIDTRVCPTCRRELPPWQTVCPDDGTTAVAPADLPPEPGPEIPAHLLEGLDDETPDDDA